MRTQLTFKVLVAIAAAVVSLKTIADESGAGVIVYAAPNGSGDGSSWDSPMSLTAALSAVETAGGEVYLKAGTYTCTAEPAVFTPQQAVVIRGGYTGTSGQSTDRVDGSKSIIDGNAQFTPMTVNNASFPVTFDCLSFTNGLIRGFKKSGAGDVLLTDCSVVSCGHNNYTELGDAPSRGYYGHGIFLQGKNSTVTFRRCYIADNYEPCLNAPVQHFSGAVDILSGMKNVRFEDCRFTNNGVAFDYYVKNMTHRIYAGAVLYAASPVTMTGCEFRGNTAICGGLVYLAGGSAGSAFTNCLWAGNQDCNGWDYSTGNERGCLVVNETNASDPVDVVNCTFAYNICTSSYAPAGVTAKKGVVNIKNSIFFGNMVHTSLSKRIDYDEVSTVAKINATYTIAYDDVAGQGNMTGDPLFQTTLEEALACVNTDKPAYPKMNLNAVTTYRFRLDGYKQVMAFDVHCRAGSKAIDAGDPSSAYGNEPSPNGGVINLGAYGNTSEAAPSPIGQPTLTEKGVEVEWVDGWSQPRITVTPGIADGDEDYVARIEVSVGKDGQTWLESTVFTGVHPNESRDWMPGILLDPATDRLCISITVRAESATPVILPLERDVGGILPPWYEKGGDPAKVVHVRPGATGRKDGTSWTDAFASIGDALAALTAEKNEIWMAGTEVLVRSTPGFAPTFDCVIRGGFTGVENSAAERLPGAVSTIDGDCAFETFTVGNKGLLTVERMRFRNAASVCFAKVSSSGSIVFLGCEFRDLVRPSSVAVVTHGVSLVGASGAEAAFTDCVFSNVLEVAQDGGYPGKGIGAYLQSFDRATLDNCRFIRCGRPLGSGFERMQTDGYGAALGASATPVTARNCLFVGCSLNDGKSGGGTVVLDGNCGGSAFTNCAWIANECYWGRDYTRSYASGALVVRGDTAGRKVDVQNCTFAYNLSDGAAAPADLNVVQGDVTVGNTIFWGAYTNAYNAVGKAARVRAGSLAISYSLVESAADIGAEAGATLVTNNIVVGDAGLVYTYAQFTNNLNAVGSGQNRVIRIKAGFETAVLPYLNVHLRGGLGYVDETTGEKVTAYAIPCQQRSAAIDAGDPESNFRLEPKPNGRRVNIGFYGNTPWATMTASGLVIVVR